MPLCRDGRGFPRQKDRRGGAGDGPAPLLCPALARSRDQGGEPTSLCRAQDWWTLVGAGVEASPPFCYVGRMPDGETPGAGAGTSAEKRRGGKGCVSTCSCRGEPNQ